MTDDRSERHVHHWNIKFYDVDGEERETIRGLTAAQTDGLLEALDREGITAQAMGYDGEGRFVSGRSESVNWDRGASTDA